MFMKKKKTGVVYWLRIWTGEKKVAQQGKEVKGIIHPKIKICFKFTSSPEQIWM